MNQIRGAAAYTHAPSLRPRTGQDLRRAFDEERRANNDLVRDAEKDRQNIDDLTSR